MNKGILIVRSGGGARRVVAWGAAAAGTYRPEASSTGPAADDCGSH